MFEPRSEQVEETSKRFFYLYEHLDKFRRETGYGYVMIIMNCSGMVIGVLNENEYALES